MAVTDYDFSRTRNQIIEAAYIKCGAHRRGQSLPGNLLVDGIAHLNDLVSSWQNDSVFLWTVQEFSITTTAEDKDYTLSTDPKVIDVQDVFIETGDNGERSPMELISWDRYLEILTPSEGGKPCKAAISRKDSPTMYLYPVPDAVYTIYYKGVTKLKDFDSASELGDFPSRFNLALIYGLAALLADDLGLDYKERERFDAKAYEHLEKAKAGDRDEAEQECVRGAFG